MSAGSMTSLGGLIGVVVCGLFIGKLGRRRMLTALSFVNLTSWLGVALAPLPRVVLLFR